MSTSALYSLLNKVRKQLERLADLTENAPVTPQILSIERYDKIEFTYDADGDITTITLFRLGNPGPEETIKLILTYDASKNMTQIQKQFVRRG